MEEDRKVAAQAGPGSRAGRQFEPQIAQQLVGQDPGVWGIWECAIHTVTAEEGETGGSSLFHVRERGLPWQLVW